MSEVEKDVEQGLDEEPFIEALARATELLAFTPEELLESEASTEVWCDYALALNIENYALLTVVDGLLTDIERLIGILGDIQVAPTLPGAQAKARETLASIEAAEEQATEQVAEMKQRLATYGGIDPTEWPDAAA